MKKCAERLAKRDSPVLENSVEVSGIKKMTKISTNEVVVSENGMLSSSLLCLSSGPSTWSPTWSGSLQTFAIAKWCGQWRILKEEARHVLKSGLRQNTCATSKHQVIKARQIPSKKNRNEQPTKWYYKLQMCKVVHHHDTVHSYDPCTDFARPGIKR